MTESIQNQYIQFIRDAKEIEEVLFLEQRIIRNYGEVPEKIKTEIELWKTTSTKD